MCLFCLLSAFMLIVCGCINLRTRSYVYVQLHLAMCGGVHMYGWVQISVHACIGVYVWWLCGLVVKAPGLWMLSSQLQIPPSNSREKNLQLTPYLVPN